VNVADLKLHGVDALGFQIGCIYYLNPPEYGIYQTEKRVLVHFADDITKQSQQRKLLSELAPLRGEINGLIDGWRSAQDRKFLNIVPNFRRMRSRTKAKRHENSSPKLHHDAHDSPEPSFRPIFTISGKKFRSKAERYDRGSADALQVALEGDVCTARALLEKVKQDILNERVGRSRFEYLLAAFWTAVAIWLISIEVMAIDAKYPCATSVNQFLCIPNAVQLWRGFVAGAAGAFFSIAIFIRTRTILPDLYRLANVMDALLRVVVGSIGGVVLVALILAQFVQFSLGSSSPAHFDDLYILIVGFVAGFIERLVPDLLAKGDARTGEAPVGPTPRPSPGAAKQPETSPTEGASAKDASPVDQQEGDPTPEQQNEDGCVTDKPIADEELTRDEDLPRASGAVDQEETPA